MTCVPPLRSRRPARILSSVDLPQPLCPTRAMRWPRYIVNVSGGQRLTPSGKANARSATDRMVLSALGGSGHLKLSSLRLASGRKPSSSFSSFFAIFWRDPAWRALVALAPKRRTKSILRSISAFRRWASRSLCSSSSSCNSTNWLNVALRKTGFEPPRYSTCVPIRSMNTRSWATKTSAPL